MNLHNHKKEFKELILIVADKLQLPELAVEKDYYIVLLLSKLYNSQYANECVFKGGTSLSKCYKGIIERFSEDIDLTYLGMEEENKTCEKALKKIETIISENASLEKIDAERSQRNKSSYIWFKDKKNKIKLEIGCSVRPDPYSKKHIKSYIHEYLEQNNLFEEIKKYELKEIELNVLNIERTFIDKIMAVKRHAICDNLRNKVRHIYDVVKLFNSNEIQSFLNNKKELKRLVQLTKQTDSFYLSKRNITKEYNPMENYNFDKWKDKFDNIIISNYEKLHETLLFTNKKQDFKEAITTFEKINNILKEINE